MVKFKLLVHIPDFYLFWSIMTIIFHVSQFNKWSTISQSKPKQTPYCPCDPGLRKHTGTLYLRQASLIFPENMMTGRYNLFLYEGSWYHPFVCFMSTIDIAFSEKLVNFRFLQIFNSCCFIYGNDETQT